MVHDGSADGIFGASGGSLEVPARPGVAVRLRVG